MAWVKEADVDGFNLSRTAVPECLESFIDLVVPILQERGVYKSSCSPGTYRQKLFGCGDRYLRSTPRRPDAGLIPPDLGQHKCSRA